MQGGFNTRSLDISAVEILRMLSVFPLVLQLSLQGGCWQEQANGLMRCRLYYPLLQLKEDTRVKEHDFSGPGPGLFSVR